MRNFSLAILGLIFLGSCSEEDHRIDISYTGEQLGSLKMPVGGVETGHMLINGDGSICASDVFGTFVPDSQETSLTFFSLYAIEEGDKPVVRIMEREHFDGSAGIAGGLESSASIGGSRGFKSAENSGGSEVSGSAGDSEDSEDTEGSGEDVQNLEAGNRFDEAVFHNAYPLMQVDLLDDEVPLEVTLSAWSPFIPLDIMDSNLPVAVFEWELTNPGKKPVSYSLAMAMQNPPGLGGQNERFSLDEFAITPKTGSVWKGFTFSNGKGNSSMPGTGMVRVISSAENTIYVPLIGDRQKTLEKFWTDFSTDGKLESSGDAAPFPGRQKYPVNEVRSLGKAESGADSTSSSGRQKYSDSIIKSSGSIESDSNLFNSSVRMDSRGDLDSTSGRLEKRGDDVKSSGSNPGMAALYTSGVLDPGESVTLPFLFSWYVPFSKTVERLSANNSQEEAACEKTGIAFEDKTLTFRYESMPSFIPFNGIDDITGYMVSEYKNLRDKTMQFSRAMITSTIDQEALLTVLSGFADAVGQRDGNTEVISNPFPNKETNGISVADRSAWDIYHATSGFAYNEEKRVMKFSPTTDVLPVRFFWATDSGWGTINVSRARIVLDCMYGSLDLEQLMLEGRSFFVFREFVPSLEANISYDNETLRIHLTENSHITEGDSFTMEIP